MRPRPLRVLSCIAAFALLAAACGASESADDSSEPDAAESASDDAAADEPEDEVEPLEEDEEAQGDEVGPRLDEMTELRMANVAYFGPEYIATAQGIDESYNLSIEMEQAASLGVPGIQAVAAGQVDTFQSAGFDAWFKSIDAGVDLVGVIGGQMSGGEFDVYRYYVRSDSGIESAADLEGTVMGIAAVGSYGDVPMDLYLEEAGLPADAVERISLPPSEIPSALINGQIDVAAAFSNVYAVLDQEYPDEASMLFRDADVLPVDEFVTAYGFSREFIEENPDVVQAFIATIQDAVAFIDENPRESQEIIAEVTGAPIDGLIIPAYPDGLCLDMSHLDDYRDILIRFNYLDEGALPNIADHFTNDLNPAC